MAPRGPSLWEFQQIFDSDGELCELIVREVIVYTVFLEEAAENYCAHEPLAGMG
jgi:hypothetical protein